MAVTGISLTDPGTGYTVQIMGAAGVAVTSLEVEPVVRVVAESRVLAHGSVDTTAYMDEASVILNLLLYDSDGTGGPQAAFMDSLGPLLQPAARPVLVVTDSEWAQARQLAVRLDSTYKVRSDPTNWPVQVNWMAPAGTWESASTVSQGITAFIGDDTGLTWTQTGLSWTTAGVAWPASDAPSPSQVVSPGTVSSQWTALLYGPCTGPKLANDTTGLTLEFTDDLVLNQGDYVLLDSSSRSALLNSGPASSVLSDLNFSTSDWWLMQPGVNEIRYYPTSAGAGSVAEVTFAPAWMT